MREFPKMSSMSGNIENDIMNSYTVEFFSLPKDIQEELTRVSLEYMKLPNEKKSPASMKTSLENLSITIKEEVESLISELHLQSC